MSKVEKLPFCEATERFGYDLLTGEVTLLKHRRYPSQAGRKVSGLDVHGYVQISILPYGVAKGHRLAWLLHYGEWPTGQIDHINGVRHDNRIENLRLASAELNAQNKRNPLSGNKSGWLGVTYYAGAYRASLMHRRKQHCIGMFKTPEEAHAAYVDAKRRMHEGCTL